MNTFIDREPTCQSSKTWGDIENGQAFRGIVRCPLAPTVTGTFIKLQGTNSVSCLFRLCGPRALRNRHTDTPNAIVVEGYEPVDLEIRVK